MMKTVQRKIKWLSRLMLAVMLFAYGIVATHACVMPDSMPASVHSVKSGAEAMPCHEITQKNDNACLLSCNQPDQVNVDQHHISFAPASAAHVLSGRLQAQHTPQVFPPTTLALNTGPPLTIRFCSFLL